jgi:hypothetical protein
MRGSGKLSGLVTVLSFLKSVQNLAVPSDFWHEEAWGTPWAETWFCNAIVYHKLDFFLKLGAFKWVGISVLFNWPTIPNINIMSNS